MNQPHLINLALCLFSIEIYGIISLENTNGQIGNLLFHLSTAISLAYDNDSPLILPKPSPGSRPEFFPFPRGSVGESYMETVFERISEIFPIYSGPPIQLKTYRYIDPGYLPIPYEPGMMIHGYFQSEKYFKHHANLIRKLFSITKPIEEYLNSKYPEIMSHPKSVGIHVRTYYHDLKRSNLDIPTFYRSWLPPDLDFYQLAMDYFDKDSLFVVCSDFPDWCKKNIPTNNRNVIFIDNQECLYDFFLLTKCKSLIIASSTFGWWAAYLNDHPTKKIVCRSPFFNVDWDHPLSLSLQVPEWTSIEMPPFWPSFPVFD